MPELNHDNAIKLAEAVVATWDYDDLEQYAVDQLVDFYLKSDDGSEAFNNDWESEGLEEYKQLSKQEIFDKVAEHLLTQMKRSGQLVYGEFECLYRGPNGTACAIGCLIPDEEYSPDMENCSFLVNQKAFPDELLRKIGIVENKGICEDLQSIHDCYEPLDWECRLKESAKYNNLEYKGYGKSETSNIKD